jgi:hypothetical protein
MVNIQTLVDDAVAKGARLLAGGKPNPQFPGGPFYLPTLLADVTPNMRIAQEEVCLIDCLLDFFFVSSCRCKKTITFFF